MPTPIGIDIAAFETVDWQRVADAGVMLGITKAFQFNPDPAFARNWEGVRNAGMMRGAFYFMPGPIAKSESLRLVSDSGAWLVVRLKLSGR
jgi:GH25 family lysozyme M1 (1,4-beta-N-acetylmuramidase)